MRKILYATDGSESATAALRFVETFPRAYAPEVQAVSVLAHPTPAAGTTLDIAAAGWDVLAQVQAEERRLAEQALQATAERLEPRGIRVTGVLRDGDPAREILAVARDWDADLIVVGSQGLTGLDRLLLGSVAWNVARHSRRPVLVAKAPRGRLDQVLVATDGSENAGLAVEFAARFPLPADAECTVVHVVRPYAPFPGLFPTDRAEFNAAVQEVNRRHHEAGETLAASAECRLAACGKQTRVTVREGDPAGEILSLAEEREADLIIAGARGASLIEGLLVGSVADRLLRDAPCSVLLVP